MTTGPNPGEESAMTADPPDPAADPPELDLRADNTADDAAGTESPATLASLAYQLFATIETQLERDQYSGEMSALAGRLDAVERGLAASGSQVDTVEALADRLEELDERLALPDPTAGAITALADRVAAAEHRLAAPHPHSATISSLVDRVDAMENRDSPHAFDSLSSRIDYVEAQIPGPELTTHMGDRMVALEKTVPEVISGLSDRLDAIEERLTVLETPTGIGAKRLVAYAIIALVVAVVATVALVALA